jgi:hypothetical protein
LIGNDFECVLLFFFCLQKVVKWFWEVVHELSEERKKKLLHFATGSDRAPIGGLKNLQLVIQRSGGDGNYCVFVD